MDSHPDSPRRARRIDDGAKGIFLAALKRGAMMEDAARATGFTLGGFWKARKADPAFAEAVDEMLELSNTPRFIAPANGRQWQLRRIRRLRFVEWRQEVFLAHFALTCDETAAAEAAGVTPATICRHRQKDPDFARKWQEALEQGYPRLEAHLVRQRLEAQQRLRDADTLILPGTGRGTARSAVEGVARETPDPAAEFDRALKLLQRWERRDGSLGPRRIAHGRRQRATFEDAIEALDRKLKALNIPLIQLPPSDASPESLPLDGGGQGGDGVSGKSTDG